MSFVLFWCFALLMLGFAAAVVFNRGPVASALCLVMSFMGLAALYFLLHAQFIGIIQILVYAGAVMVLFLFIIMLLDLRAEKRRKLNLAPVLGGVVVAIAFVAQLVVAIDQLPFPDRHFPVLPTRFDDVGNIGRVLFSAYNLPFQVVGVLLLVATVGVVVLSKKELK